jgi:hypothetical protein
VTRICQLPSMADSARICNAIGADVEFYSEGDYVVALAQPPHAPHRISIRFEYEDGWGDELIETFNRLAQLPDCGIKFSKNDD